MEPEVLTGHTDTHAKGGKLIGKVVFQKAEKKPKTGTKFGF